MAALPDTVDPTLEAADRALEARQGKRHRTYLGMSSVGDPCERKLWYSQRWCSEIQFDALSLKRFVDGHHGEALQADRLRMVDGVTLYTFDPETGDQFEESDCNGHFCGHLDGMVIGLLQAPQTFHVWEHKQVGEKKQAKLVKLKAGIGEKHALKAWDETYYAQAMLYCYYSKLDRHYLTCSTPGGRSTISVRTESDTPSALRLIEKAERIINAPRPPAGISTDPTWWQCRFCDHQGVCQEAKPAPRNCRTCFASSPVEDGQWHCSVHDKLLTVEEQRAGCDRHRYIMDLVAGNQEDFGGEGESLWIEYRMKDGTPWRDTGP